MSIESGPFGSWYSSRGSPPVPSLNSGAYKIYVIQEKRERPEYNVTQKAFDHVYLHKIAFLILVKVDTPVHVYTHKYKCSLSD